MSKSEDPDIRIKVDERDSEILNKYEGTLVHNQPVEISGFDSSNHSKPLSLMNSLGFNSNDISQKWSVVEQPVASPKDKGKHSLVPKIFTNQKPQPKENYLLDDEMDSVYDTKRDKINGSEEHIVPTSDSRDF